MNSLVKVFSNFKEFYSEINGATLTGAIDVIVVEQPDGEFQCSPFHVRFGKLGVLRSREKVVDIEINGEPVDIHMKLGESGEAFFVEECQEEEVEELPENLATSPIPTSYFPSKYTDANTLTEHSGVSEGKSKNASDDLQMPLPLPRRNSIDFSKEVNKNDDNESKFENQVSDYSHRRHTDNTLERRNLAEKLKEYTTQKIRQEWAEHEEVFQFDPIEKDKDWSNSTQTETCQVKAKVEITPPEEETKDDLVIIKTSKSMSNAMEKEENNADDAVTTTTTTATTTQLSATQSCTSLREDSKGGKKKRRKKSQMKKKNSQRKSSSSSSLGSNAPMDGNPAATTNTTATATTTTVTQLIDEGDGLSISISNNSSNDDEAGITTNTKSGDPLTTSLLSSAMGGNSNEAMPFHQQSIQATPTRIVDLDIHFFSDTEVTSSGGGNIPVRNAGGRPSTPIQSDSELEISLREKDSDAVARSASWKWGELPTPEAISEGKDVSAAGQAQAQRNSMLSGMFNFMKKTNKMRKVNEGGGVYLSDLEAEGMNPEIAALYFPNALKKESSPAPAGGVVIVEDEDRESGNGTSLPHSPSSMEGQKSLDSDYEDGIGNGKNREEEGKYLDFVAMSLCGASGEKGLPTDEEFDRDLIKYSDVCKNPSLFLSPNLFVRLNGKYYSWAAACPIVMTIITFQKPLPNNAIEQLMRTGKLEVPAVNITAEKHESDNVGQAKRSWWNWRRTHQNQYVPAGRTSVEIAEKVEKVIDEKDADQKIVAATQTTRPNSPDVSDNTLSKTDSTLNAENTSAMVDNLEDLSQASSKSEGGNGDGNKMGLNERFKKSLRLSSEAIKKLNLKEGMNEIEFSVTTAYQGTSRCKCYLFRWKHSDKVVISDIDGTITKSDVLGHLLPMVGKDWAQLGVAQLFSKIEQNGYKLLYLSARAIGQSRATREYLRSIRQGDVQLPDGPLLLNPTSLISAFHREVIERKPEQFKIACLSDIRDLFPNKDPFYAGYGNRINDVWAYRAVGIPIMRIFTINTKGELKHELTQTFQSSYCSMAYIVDQLFPPLKADEGSIEFSSFNFWREPIPEVDIDVSFGVNTSIGSAVNNTVASIPNAANTSTNSVPGNTLEN